MLQGKKRFLFIGLLLLELISLPAAAQIVQKVSFDIRPIVTAVEIPTAEPGVSRYLVASNAGFSVQAKDIIGTVEVDVHVSGTMGVGNRFGDSAQLPGPKLSCSQTSGTNAVIYIADRKTAASHGTPPEQAVVFEFQYSSEIRPSFEFVAGVAKTPSAPKCAGKNS